MSTYVLPDSQKIETKPNFCRRKPVPHPDLARMLPTDRRVELSSGVGPEGVFNGPSSR